jgi:hypothetical protein
MQQMRAARLMMRGFYVTVEFRSHCPGSQGVWMTNRMLVSGFIVGVTAMVLIY